MRVCGWLFSFLLFVLSVVVGRGGCRGWAAVFLAVSGFLLVFLLFLRVAML